MATPNWKKAQNKVQMALKRFEAERKDFWFKTFTDTYAARGEYVQSQPADAWVLYKGIFWLLEIKSCEQARFPFKDVRPSQWAGVRRAHAAGGKSVFVLAKPPKWDWYVISGPELYNRKMSGDKSVSWEELRLIKLEVENFIR